ncbi:MAG: helix-turn-helix domain-containing protein [Candidatus Methanomethylophilaceae archaeon]|nr:helix-turn-helix domain-containing protein [Candidatus Methanomethylophilaceae archaeon]
MYCCKILLDRSSIGDERPCTDMVPRGSDAGNASMTVLSCSMIGEGTGQSMIRISTDGDTIPVGCHAYPEGECDVTRISRGNYLAMVTNRRCLLAKLVNRSGCFLSSAVPKSKGLVEWTVLGPNWNKVHGLLKDLKAHGYEYRTLSSGNASTASTLTPKQERYIYAAYEMGYYDIPKRADLDDLCGVLGCSKSTLNISLRTAEKRLFEYHRNLCRRDQQVSDP